jgi:transposase-like protein
MKQAVERVLKAEQEVHLGYEPYQKGEGGPANSRNGYSKKTLKTAAGPVEIAVPRDREGTFSPQFVQRHQTTDPDLERKITGMYARGMSTRDIQDQLKELYGTDVSPMLISRVTDKLLEGIRDWQVRPLDDVYPVLFLDAIHYKVRHEGKVVAKAAYTCLGIGLDGRVDVLGMWISEAEGAHFWLTVLTDLKSRGVNDVFIACVDGLKGFPDAIATVFPRAQVQLCVVHQIRTSLRYLNWKHQRAFIADLKRVYRAPNREVAEEELQALDVKWRGTCEYAVKGWVEHWPSLSTFFDYPVEIRRMIYTTNAVEAVHRQFRKVTKTRGAFPTDDALKKMLYLATLGLKGSLRSKKGWPTIMGQLRIIFADRMPENVF